METEKDLTAERSLEIIRQSIEQSRRAVMKNSGTPMLIWGVLVFCTALVVGHLWEHAGGPKWNLLWFVMTIVGFAANYWVDKKHEHHPTGFVGKAIGYVWISFAIFALAIPLSTIIVDLCTDTTSANCGYQVFFQILTAIEILLMGICATISGYILNNKIIVICGIISGIGGLWLASFINGGSQMLVLAGVAILTLIIPGLVMNRQSKRASL